MIQIIPPIPDQSVRSSGHLSGPVPGRVNPSSLHVKSGWLSSELWLLVLFMFKNAVLLLIVLLCGSSANGGAGRSWDGLATLAGVTCVAAAEGAALWRYVTSRETLKQAAMMLGVAGDQNDSYQEPMSETSNG